MDQTQNPSRNTSLARMGGAMGIAANCIGWLIFLLLCHGYGAAAVLAPLPLALGIIGMALTVIGGITQPHADIDTHVLAAIFLNLFGIVGGMLEMAVWRNWTLFAR